MRRTDAAGGRGPAVRSPGPCRARASAVAGPPSGTTEPAVGRTHDPVGVPGSVRAMRPITRRAERAVGSGPEGDPAARPRREGSPFGLPPVRLRPVRLRLPARGSRRAPLRGPGPRSSRGTVARRLSPRRSRLGRCARTDGRAHARRDLGDREAGPEGGGGAAQLPALDRAAALHARGGRRGAFRGPDGLRGRLGRQQLRRGDPAAIEARRRRGGPPGLRGRRGGAAGGGRGPRRRSPRPRPPRGPGRCRARRSTRAAPSRASWWAAPTRSPRPRRAAWRRGRWPSTRCSSTAAWASARRT